MASLPDHRTAGTASPAPFSTCGVDAAGPFFTTDGYVERKRYLYIFTCTTTRLAHVEVATSLATDNFLMVFDRFLARW